jgi:hypothetical protein
MWSEPLQVRELNRKVYQRVYHSVEAWLATRLKLVASLLPAIDTCAMKRPAADDLEDDYVREDIEADDEEEGLIEPGNESIDDEPSTKAVATADELKALQKRKRREKDKERKAKVGDSESLQSKANAFSPTEAQIDSRRREQRRLYNLPIAFSSIRFLVPMSESVDA